MKTIIMAAALFVAGISVANAQTKAKTAPHKTKHKIHHAKMNAGDSTTHKTAAMKTKTTATKTTTKKK